MSQNKPEISIRAGSIHVAVWNNHSTDEEGELSSYKTVSFERRYKDKEGNWKSTTQLRTNDLPKAKIALEKAYEYLILREAELA